ncbi:MAG: hypothetical protein LAQ69_17365 [Acidobacteriia bacterium]|nr:hypothetical protein [Terriglobia bacterium]
MPPEEPALAARRAYGGVELAKELHREARSFVWIEQLLKDVRYGWRNLLRNPGFTILASIALALGIGANATIFGIYNAIALKQLPVADASRVVRVKRWTGSISLNNFAYPEYEYLRDHNRVFSGVTASSSAIPVLASIAGGAARQHVKLTVTRCRPTTSPISGSRLRLAAHFCRMKNPLDRCKARIGGPLA